MRLVRVENDCAREAKEEISFRTERYVVERSVEEGVPGSGIQER
jgi:hypothetical protein